MSIISCSYTPYKREKFVRENEIPRLLHSTSQQEPQTPKRAINPLSGELSFWDLVEWEQTNQNTDDTRKSNFKSLCIPILLTRLGDRQKQLHLAIQEQCPILEEALKKMGAVISKAEEAIARTLTPLQSSVNYTDKYGKLIVSSSNVKNKIRPSFCWPELVRRAIDLEKNFKKERSQKDSSIDEEAIVRVGDTLTRFFTSMARWGWNPNKESPNPLHLSAREDCPMVAEAMIIRNADVHSQENGETPLSLASRFNHSDVVRILKKHMSSEQSSEATPEESKSNTFASSSRSQSYSAYASIDLSDSISSFLVSYDK